MVKINDEKALDLRYKSQIEFPSGSGEIKKLGRTNKIMTRELRELITKASTLPETSPIKELEKMDEEIRKMIKKFISPISKKELEIVEEDDLIYILELIEKRKLRRQGYNDKQITELEKAGVEEQFQKTLHFIKTGEVLEDFPNQNMEKDGNIKS
jgi:Na+/phosphate symporter